MSSNITPRYRLVALVRADAFAPHVQREGEKLPADYGDEQWFADNISCQQACPAGTDVPRYIALLANADYRGAYLVNLASNLFPGILCRVCTHPCEQACRRGRLDTPVAICHLKRAAADNTHQLLPQQDRPTGQKVAIVGSGPTGLAAAWDLVTQGHSVTVYESRSEGGGLLRWGIPPYRLPRREVYNVLSSFRELVSWRLSTKLGTDLSLTDLSAQYDAVLLALGASQPCQIGIPGENAEGVLYGLDFMNMVNSDLLPSLSQRRVAVIGGGSTAVDCARSALRLGAEQVWIVLSEVLVGQDMLQEAQREGVEVLFQTIPLFVQEAERKVQALHCAKTELRINGMDAGHKLVAIPGSEFDLDASLVIVAIGQSPNVAMLEESLRVEEGRLVVDTESLMTSFPGVFAAGDLVTGPGDVIHAIAMGRQVAQQINLWLGNGPAESCVPSFPANWSERVLQERLGQMEDFKNIPRQAMPTCPMKERQSINQEIELGYTPDEIRQESRRCLQCQLNVFVDESKCVLCNRCVLACPHQCLQIASLNRLSENVPKLAVARQSWLDGGALILDETFCTRCGQCIAVCPPKCLTLAAFPNAPQGTT